MAQKARFFSLAGKKKALKKLEVKFFCIDYIFIYNGVPFKMAFLHL